MKQDFQGKTKMISMVINDIWTLDIQPIWLTENISS